MGVQGGLDCVRPWAGRLSRIVAWQQMQAILIFKDLHIKHVMAVVFDHGWV